MWCLSAVFLAQDKVHSFLCTFSVEEYNDSVNTMMVLDFVILNLITILNLVPFLLLNNLTVIVKFSYLTRFGHTIDLDQKYDQIGNGLYF